MPFCCLQTLLSNFFVLFCLLQCVGTIVLIFITDVGSLLRFYVFTVWLFHGVTMLGLLVMRWKKNNYYKPYKVMKMLELFDVVSSLGARA